MKNRIRELRKSHNESQEELGKIVGVTKSAISKYELGTLDIPNNILILIANHYNTTTDYILCRTSFINEPISIAASVKNGVDLSEISDADKETIMKIIEMAKNKNKNKNKNKKDNF